MTNSICNSNTRIAGETLRVAPFLKWAGGKRWLAQKGVPTPSHFDRLVEPFVGSAAIFFSVGPQKALLADINEELMNLYQMVKYFPNEFQENHSESFYYKIRSERLVEPLARAARMLYLNRTCWNGLYRVNRRGEFNVPIGSKTSVLVDNEQFSRYAKKLASAEIRCQDFEITIDGCGAGDFLFVDPPYTVKHNMNGFVKYNENIFSWDDQVRLARALRRSAERGAMIVVTNADHQSLHDLYLDDFAYKSVARQSVLAGRSAYRGKTTEAIFTLNF